MTPNDLIAQDTWTNLVATIGEQNLAEVAAQLGLEQLGILINVLSEAGALAALGAVRGVLMQSPEYTFVDFLTLIDSSILNIERSHL